MDRVCVWNMFETLRIICAIGVAPLLCFVEMTDCVFGYGLGAAARCSVLL